MALKEKALKRLAEKMNAAGIPWAVGAGWLLSQKGIAPTYHDFDLFVSPDDAARADKVLSRLGMRSVEEEGGECFRAAYHFDGADIELCAGMVLDGKWHARFDQSSIAEDIPVLGVPAHVMHLEDWLVYYLLMGRDAKAEAIGAYLRVHGADAGRFALAVAEPLPQELLTRIDQLLEG